jgi:hypothetical protein
MDRPLPRRRDTDPHVWLVHLSSGSEHAAGGESARRRRDFTTLYLQFEKEAEAALGLRCIKSWSRVDRVCMTLRSMERRPCLPNTSTR